MLVMISACGVLAEPGRQLLVQVLELAVEVEQLTGKPGDHWCGDRFPGQYDGLFTGDGDRGCGHGEDAGRPRLLGAQELRHRIDTGGAKPGGSLKPGEQDQRRAGGVVERFFQAGEDRAEQLAEPVDPAHPVGHQVRSPRGEHLQVTHDPVGQCDLGQIPTQPRGLGDRPRILGIGLALAGERSSHPVDQPAWYRQQPLSRRGQQRHQQRR
jgi:hypothetical protein